MEKPEGNGGGFGGGRGFGRGDFGGENAEVSEEFVIEAGGSYFNAVGPATE